MTMIPKERVQNALRRVDSRHPPFTWGFGPNEDATRQFRAALSGKGYDWDRLRSATEDVAWLHPRYIGEPLPEGQVEYMAIWGIETRQIDYGAGIYNDEIFKRPLEGVEDADAFDEYAWPTTDDFDYDSLNEARRNQDPDGVKAVRLTGGNPFEIYCWTTGMEDALVNLIVNPELVRAGLKHICRFFKAHVQRQVEAFGSEVDLVQLADDLGSQSGLLLSCNAYRDVIQPCHREMCAHIHTLLPNSVIEFHSDGAVFDMIPDVMQAGVQMLEAIQVECAGMEPEALAEAYGDQLMFQGGISVQQLLSRNTPEKVRMECRRLIDTLGRGGGYLAAPSHAIQAGTPPENVLAMLQEILGEERFQTALQTVKIRQG